MRTLSLALLFGITACGTAARSTDAGSPSDAGAAIDGGPGTNDGGPADSGTRNVDSGQPGQDAGGLTFNIPLASLTAHNTSANPTYDQSHFGANFGTTSWVSQGGATIPVDPTKMDRSLNPVTPAHVSAVDVHTLIPSRPDLRWFAHATPWFKTGGQNHIDIGINCDSAAYVRSMITDMENRGFDGVIIDWYGQGSYEDQVTLLIQQYLASVPNNTFKFIIMMDQGIPNLSQSVLQTQVQYVQSQYFTDPNYELEGGQPILMFFGVDSALGSTAMSQVKSATGGNMVWVTQGSGSLSQSWVDECFDWTHDYKNGDVASDPYNLTGVGNFYAAVAGSPKKVFGSMVAGFNGTLTNKVSWSMGKYLPRGSGACLVQWAKKIDSVIPANVNRIQWATWSDWEEGSEIEAAVENDVKVSPSVAGTSLGWTVSSGTGDETTIDHYEVYVSADGVNAADLGPVAAGTHTLNLAPVSGLQPGTTYQLYVDAVGRPNIRDHLSGAAAYTP